MPGSMDVPTANSGDVDDFIEDQTVDPRFPLQAGHQIIKGVRMFAPCTPGHMVKLQEHEVSPTDWYIITYPKAGTTWMQEITWLIKKDGDTQMADTVPVFNRVPFIEMPLPDYDDNHVDWEGQVLYKSHFPYKLLPKQIINNKAKIVMVHRDPRDLAVSYYHFYINNAFQGNWDRSWDDFLEMFLTGNCTNGDWFDWMLDWWKVKDDSHILHITYEWMKANPRESIKKVGTFLGRNLSEETVDLIAERTHFDTMKKNPMSNYTLVKEIKSGTFMRKGIVGDWKTQFTVAQSERISARYHEAFQGHDDLKKFLNYDI